MPLKLATVSSLLAQVPAGMRSDRFPMDWTKG